MLGLDLSPHFLAVGRRLHELGRAEAAAGDAGTQGGWQWINDWRGYTDPRVELRRADVAATGLPSSSVDVVAASMLIHELPPAATREVAIEALRLLRPGGQLWITEMDFETPAFSKLHGCVDSYICMTRTLHVPGPLPVCCAVLCCAVLCCTVRVRT